MSPLVVNEVGQLLNAQLTPGNVNLLCGLIADCHQPKKPSLEMDWVLPQFNLNWGYLRIYFASP
ncbi:MAG: hypothetical protein AAGF26_13285 [Cyanobacteria bacterium P01_G01_bin.49]